MTDPTCEHRRPWLLLATALGVQLLFITLAIRPVWHSLATTPILQADFTFHYFVNTDLDKSLQAGGGRGVYAPRLEAGWPYPDAGLTSRTMNPMRFLPADQWPLAFNLSILFWWMTHILCFWLIVSRRGWSPSAQWLVMLLFFPLWWFGATRKILGGSTSYMTVVFMTMLLLSEMTAFGQRMRLWHWGAIAALWALAFWVHPHAAVLGTMFGVAALVVGAFRWHWKTVVAIAGWGVVAIAANAYWLLPMLKHNPDSPGIDAPMFGAGSTSPMWFVPRVAFFAVCIAAAIYTYKRQEKEHKVKQFPAMAIGTVFCAVYAMLGPRVPAIARTEPDRFIQPALALSVLMLGFAAASWCDRRFGGARAKVRAGFAALGCCLLVAMASWLVVRPQIADFSKSSFLPALADVEARHPTGRTWIPRQSSDELEPSLGGPGVSCIYPNLAVILSDLPIVGQHNAQRLSRPPNILYNRQERVLADLRVGHTQSLRQFAIDYNLQYAIIGEPAVLKAIKKSGFVRVIGQHGPFTDLEFGGTSTGYFMSGSGHVDASLNRLGLSDLKPADDGTIVLRYHFGSGLRADDPAVKISEGPNGFIKLANVKDKVVLTYRP